jgi:DNA-binding NtrC family response regulator
VGAEREPVTVLFVHDDTVVHELVEGTLGDEFRVLTAGTAARAMALFERHAPAVVVIDLTVGDVRCEEIFEPMRAREPGLRAVFFADQDDPQRALRLGDLGTVLPRRRDLDRLRLAIRNAARFRALSEDVARLRSDAERASTTTSRRAQQDVEVDKSSPPPSRAGDALEGPPSSRGAAASRPRPRDPAGAPPRRGRR